ncbi:MAG: glycosyltransferase [Bacteroidota bacterium]|nr:glycosyltransferase [Bacteroidota bacterium]
MKIVHTNKAYYPLIGGVETIVANIVEGLASVKRTGVELLVCNNLHSFSIKRKLINGVNVTYVPMWMKIASLPISPSYPFYLLKFKGDIIHIHEPFPLADISVLLFLPFIRKNFSRIVVSWHSDIVRQKWALWIYSFLLHSFLKKVDLIIVATPNHISSSKFLQRYSQKCEIIPYGLKLDWVNDAESRYNEVKSIREKYGTPLLLFVGRLVYYKGIKYLVDALVSLPNVNLIIIGTGPLYNELQNQINSNGLGERVSILCNVSDSDLYSFYEACDIFVLPSTEPSEAFGLVQVEAMACGKPVVSTNLGTGVSFVNQNGITGITVQPRDSKALAEAINLLIVDSSFRETLGKNAKYRAFKEFNVESMVEKVFNTYEILLNGNAKKK